LETQFLLLGPVVVRTDGSATGLPPAKQRALLAALLLHANHVVSVDALAELLWGTELPSAPRTGLQNYVMRLRKADALASIGWLNVRRGRLIQAADFYEQAAEADQVRTRLAAFASRESIDAMRQ
jgi:DNA-binding SARP family transcriptional activator